MSERCGTIAPVSKQQRLSSSKLVEMSTRLPEVVKEAWRMTATKRVITAFDEGRQR
jgi:hypothetical protein